MQIRGLSLPTVCLSRRAIPVPQASTACLEQRCPLHAPTAPSALSYVPQMTPPAARVLLATRALMASPFPSPAPRGTTARDRDRPAHALPTPCSQLSLPHPLATACPRPLVPLSTRLLCSTRRCTRAPLPHTVPLAHVLLCPVLLADTGTLWALAQRLHAHYARAAAIASPDRYAQHFRPRAIMRLQGQATSA